MSMVSTVSPWSWIYGMSVTALASAAWPTNALGQWTPIGVPTVCVARRMWWVNGSTVSGSNNVEVGIYRDAGFKPGAKLITTGSVAQGTASQVQFVDITDTTLTPQLYWLYMSCSTTAATFGRQTIAFTGYDELYRFQQASVGPGSAPDPATPAESGSAFVPWMGFSTTTIT